MCAAAEGRDGSAMENLRRLHLSDSKCEVGKAEGRMPWDEARESIISVLQRRESGGGDGTMGNTRKRVMPYGLSASVSSFSCRKEELGAEPALTIWEVLERDDGLEKNELNGTVVCWKDSARLVTFPNGEEVEIPLSTEMGMVWGVHMGLISEELLSCAIGMGKDDITDCVQMMNLQTREACTFVLPGIANHIEVNDDGTNVVCMQPFQGVDNICIVESDLANMNLKKCSWMPNCAEFIDSSSNALAVALSEGSVDILDRRDPNFVVDTRKSRRCNRGLRLKCDGDALYLSFPREHDGGSDAVPTRFAHAQQRYSGCGVSWT